MTHHDDDQEREELEHIPWSMLADELNGGRSRTMVSLVVAVLVLLVVAFVGVRALRRTPGTVVDVPADAPATTVAVNVTTVPTEAPGEADTPGPARPAPGLYAEADLMAAAPEQEQRLAVARAEWFVVDYFTVDDVGADEPASWVEWARATEVAAAGPGVYDVVVVFSTLARDQAGAYARAAPRAVRVAIEISAPGAAAPVDLPAPASLETGEPFDPPPPGDDAVPDEVAAAAVEAAAAFGSPGEVTGGSATSEGWRVVVSVADSSGIRFPLVVRVDG